MPRILIGIPSRIEGRYRPFDVALHQLTAQRSDCEVFYAMTGVIPGQRNRIVRKAFEVDADYIWFLDDDQPFNPGCKAAPVSDLDQLLAHNLDAVIPLSVRRGPPFLPLLYDYIHEGWHAHQHYLRDHEKGLIPVAGAGMAGLLIKTDCLRRMGSDGWFEFVHPPDSYDDYAEDFPFYHKLSEMGVQLYCDLEVRFGHLVQCAAYPIRQHGKWVTAFADVEPFAMMPQLEAPPGSPRVLKPTKDEQRAYATGIVQ